ncbi:MAG: HAD family phosphatase [Candidatus Woesearchaeota archaeon]|nr:HAD family phosphatase [Candidatus Woesearchaeota archaeon]
MIDRIIFDLSEVYIRGLPGIESTISERTGIPEKKVFRHLRGPRYNHLIRLFKAEMTEDQYWRMVRKEGAYKPPISWFKQTVRENFTEIPGTRAIIEQLKERYPLALLSDHCREWIENIEERYPITELFDRIFYSFNTGHTKSERRCFDHVLVSLNANPETTLYIDDLAQNLALGRKAGIAYTHQFTTAEKLEEELRKLRVLRTNP